MYGRVRSVTIGVLGGMLSFIASPGFSQAPAQLCQPIVSGPIVVATAAQRLKAGSKSEPPITDLETGFAWPDTPLGVLKTIDGYEFFGSDGASHSRQVWRGHVYGNGKSGSVVKTIGTLDDPLGTENPGNVEVSPNQDLSVNPSYPSYGYVGGGPVYQVPAFMPGAGNLLVTYHAELPKDALYAALGLAASMDGGRHWKDLGEIIRLNQSYALGLDGFEIGDGPLVLSPDGKYFYLYFPDWRPNGTLHTTTEAGVSTTTNVSVARAPVDAVLKAAFASSTPHAVTFEKFYKGSWELQPAVGGASTDLVPRSPYQGYLDIHFSEALHRYVMLISDDTNFGYAESVDALNWTVPTLLGVFGPIAAYPTAVGLGEDPHVLGKRFYVFFTHLPTDGSGWSEGELKRLTLSCP